MTIYCSKSVKFLVKFCLLYYIAKLLYLTIFDLQKSWPKYTCSFFHVVNLPSHTIVLSDAVEGGTSNNVSACLTQTPCEKTSTSLATGSPWKILNSNSTLLAEENSNTKFQLQYPQITPNYILVPMLIQVLVLLSWCLLAVPLQMYQVGQKNTMPPVTFPPNLQNDPPKM